MLSAVALDISGTAWATSAGSVYLLQPEQRNRWTRVWNDENFGVPFVDASADVGVVRAVAVGVAVVEGRVVVSPSASWPLPR